MNRRSVLSGIWTGVLGGASLCLASSGFGRARQEPVAASVTFEDQRSDGRTVTVKRASSPVKAFVVIQDNSGRILTEKRENRVSLDAGEVVEDSTFTLEETLTESQRLVATLIKSNDGPLDSDSAYISLETGGSKTERSNTRAIGRDEREVEYRDWKVHTTAEISEDGSAVVTKTVSGSDIPDYELDLDPSASEIREILQGEEDLEMVGDEHPAYLWNTADGDSVVFRVQLGVMHRHGKNGVFNNGVLLGTEELVPLNPGDRPGSKTRPKAQQYEIIPPDGWTTVAPGRKVAENTYELEPVVNDSAAPDDYIAIGELDVAERQVNGTIVRAAVFAETSPPHTATEMAEFLAEITPTIHDQFGSDGSEELPRLGVVTPVDYEVGGSARGHSFITNERRQFYKISEGRSLYTHEYAHTFQQHHSSTGFFLDGIPSYLQHLTLLEAGIITEDEYRGLFRRWVTVPRFRRGFPIRKPATEGEYHKAAATFAALDLDIRARTDGDADITDFIIAINDQAFKIDSEYPYGISHGEALAALEQITGHDYTEFFNLYASVFS